MGCLGVHFAIEPVTAQRLLDADDDDELLEIIEELEEEGEHDAWTHDSDKSWDALHRCFADGELDWDSGSYPLNHVVLGGKRLYHGDDYTICLVRPDQVPDVGAALKPITEAEFRKRYEGLAGTDYDGELSDDDFQYTWENIPGLVDLFERASANGRAVIFTADQ